MGWNDPMKNKTNGPVGFGLTEGGLAVPLSPVVRRIVIQIHEDGRGTCETSKFHNGQHVGAMDAVTVAAVLSQFATAHLAQVVAAQEGALGGKTIKEG